MKFIVGSSGDRLSQALLDAAVINEPLSSIARIVIDLKAGAPARIYIEKFADDSIADVLPAAGIADIEVDQ